MEVMMYSTRYCLNCSSSGVVQHCIEVIDKRGFFNIKMVLGYGHFLLNVLDELNNKIKNF